MATIWEDDFESGNALSVSYSVGPPDDLYGQDAETASGCGRNSSWGFRGTGSDSEKYHGHIIYDIGSGIETNYVRVKLDTDRSFYQSSYVGTWAFCLWDTEHAYGAFLELDHGFPTDDSYFEIYSYWLAEPLTGTGLSVSSWQTVVLEIWFSTTYPDGGYYAPNADGRVKVSIDGVTALDESGLEIIGPAAVISGQNNVEHVAFGPMGNGDNIGIYTDELSVITPGSAVLTVLGNQPTVDAVVPYYWTPIANYVEQELNSESFENAQVTIRADAWSRDAGVPIKLRLWNTTIGQSAGESPEVIATEPTDATFVVTLNTGWNTYRLEAGSETPGVEVFAVATLSAF